MKVLTDRAIRDGKALWPERFPLRELRKRKEAMGSVMFNLQYQNDPKCALGAVFKEEWLRFYDETPGDLAVYQGVDLAISAGRFADYFAILTVGADRDGAIYVLDVLRARLSFERQARAVEEKAAEFDPALIAIEATGYQAALHQVLASRTALPVRPVRPSTDKVTRMLRLGALFENGKVFLKPSQVELREELLAFPEGEHDDLCDALEMAVNLARRRGGRFLSIAGV